jgi:hypothetical protein
MKLGHQGGASEHDQIAVAGTPAADALRSAGVVDD